ncbi:hypothetical protein GALMADRAFT_132757 [Galerina marginata CBS 339.88]|uniref:F-box domain-containing protein n=1 Tax=Galerina marginata (strain CBS 339.88) TaxID=685588 RepID=A0A067TSH1_GALM3|nr:hypothetical protein GALMADRAFT_132757 [Galerina marginata CBS 339.88]
MAELKTTESLGLPSSCRPLSQQNRKNHYNISSAKPPILKLHNDILWWIFWLNADMEDEAEEEDTIAAIDTLRYSSQVCSVWRHVILSFSSLWGQVINLSHLEHDDWREEVLRRTGRSLLSVLWVYPGAGRLSENLAAEILRSYWNRIRWLELDFTSIRWGNNFNIAQFWEIFQRPSEVLEAFRVFFHRKDRNPSLIISPSDFVVFNNLAPALRVFFAPNIKFKLDAPWLGNIRFLALNGQVSAYDVIQAIPHMPLLECLTDETSAIACSGDARHALFSLPQITAPSIKEIILLSYKDMGRYMDFLAQIKPAAGCYLTFSHTGLTPDAKTLTLANEVLYTYSRCCDFPNANYISLDLDDNHFNVEVQVPGKGQFCFEIRPHQSFRCNVVEALFAALPSVEFQELTVNPETLEFLLNLPGDILALSFPVLHTVEIPRYLMEEELSTIKQFLTSRISIGRPVGVLSIPIDLNCYKDSDLRSLEELTGLTIILQYGGKKHEHTCGNGCVEDLLIPCTRRQWDSDSSSSRSSSESL